MSKSGADVTVLEQETIGWGDSSCNGGIFSPGIAAGIQTIAKRFSMQLAKSFWQWSLDASTCVENINSDERLDCDYQQDGQIYLAYKPDHFTSARKYVDYVGENFGYTGHRNITRFEIL